jgi:hypothetical protein
VAINKPRNAESAPGQARYWYYYMGLLNMKMGLPGPRDRAFFFFFFSLAGGHC